MLFWVSPIFLGSFQVIMAKPEPASGFATKTSPQGAPLPTDHSIYNIYERA